MASSKFGQLPRSKFSIPNAFSRGGGFNPNKEPENPLTGKVQDLKAAAGEERLSRTLNKSINKGLIEGYRFRFTTAPRASIYYKELDFLVLSHTRAVAISVKGEDFVHKSSSSKNQDLINELIILAKLKKYGYDIPKVTTIAASDLETQEGADNAAKKIGLYR